MALGDFPTSEESFLLLSQGDGRGSDQAIVNGIVDEFCIFLEIHFL